MTNKCSNCGRPTKYRLCANCFLELRRREAIRQQNMTNKLNFEKKTFLYGE